MDHQTHAINSSSSSSNITAVIKLSQRPAKSCSECVRRKTRCDKKYPCDPCCKRGVESLCRPLSQYRAVDAPQSASVHTSPQHVDLAGFHDSDFADRVLAELDSLRRRVATLEGDRLGNVPTEAMNDARDYRTRRNVDEPGDAATTLEFLALGLDRRLRTSPPPRNKGNSIGTSSLLPTSHLVNPNLSPIDDLITSSLLPRHTTDAIIRFAESQGAWQHCCVWFPSFTAQLEVFWQQIDSTGGADGWARVDGTWLGLLYVIMGTGVHQMSERDAAQCGLSDADRYVLPSAFIAAAIASLTHGSFLSRPTMWTVQAIAILTLCGHNVCESDLLSSLLAVGIKTAQTLGLHSMGRGGYTNDSMSAIELELCKRVWWGLVQEDWFSIPFRGAWSIHLDHFNTPMPTNCNDADLLSGKNNGQLTVAFKCRFSSQVALVVQDVFSRLRGTESAFIVADSAADRIRHLLLTLPAALGTSPPPGSPSWASAMRHYIVISATHKILIIYRASLARDLTGHERRKASAACTDAAHSIVDELDRGGRLAGVSQSLWTIPYHGLAAGVVLGIDLIKLLASRHSDRGSKTDAMALIDKRRAGVQRARQGLERLSPTSRIARRGLQVLDDLMLEVDAYVAGDKKGRGSMAGIVKRIPLPTNELIETPPPSPPSAPVHAQDQPLYHEPNEPWLDFDLGEIDMEAFLHNLQQSVPDVGRLFDGSLGAF